MFLSGTKISGRCVTSHTDHSEFTYWPLSDKKATIVVVEELDFSFVALSTVSLWFLSFFPHSLTQTHTHLHTYYIHTHTRGVLGWFSLTLHVTLGPSAILYLRNLYKIPPPFQTTLHVTLGPFRNCKNGHKRITSCWVLAIAPRDFFVRVGMLHLSSVFCSSTWNEQRALLWDASE